MSTKIAFLFPGQGSQAVGMGRDLAERFPIAAQTFAEADEALGFPISKLIFEGPEEDLRLTENTQPAILTVSVAAWRALGAPGVGPAPAAAAPPCHGALPRRVVGTRGPRNVQLCRCRPRRQIPWPGHAVGRPRRPGPHGRRPLAPR